MATAKFAKRGFQATGLSGHKANEMSWGPDFAQDIADREGNGHPGLTYWERKEDGKFGFTAHAMSRFVKFGAETVSKVGTNSTGDDLGKDAIKFLAHDAIGTLPVGLDLRRIDLSREGIVFTNQLERVATSSTTVVWNYIDADVAADFIAITGDDGDVAYQNDTYDTHTRTVVGLYTAGTVTDLAAAVAGDGRGLYQEVFDARMRAMDLAEEKQNLLSTGAGGDADGYLAAYSIWDGATAIDKNSSSLDLADLDQALTNVAAVNLPNGLAGVNYGVTDYATHAAIAQQLQTFGRMDATANAFGFAAPLPVVYRGVSIYPSQVMPSGANVKRLYLGDLSRQKIYTVMDKVLSPVARTLSAATGGALSNSFAIQSWLVYVDFTATDDTNSDGTGAVDMGAIQEIS